MSRLSKKMMKEIEAVSVIEEIVQSREGRKIGDEHWLNTPPDMWMKDESDLYDLVNDIEMKLKEKIVAILTTNL